LSNLQDLEFTDASINQLDQCCKVVKEQNNNAIPLPKTVTGVLQLTRKGAQGKLKHEIPADG
jgi:hypothetical protein